MDLNKEVDNNENFHYVYFIESHDTSLNAKISLSEKYSESNTLELVEKTEKKDSFSNFSVNIYRFKIIPRKINENLEIEVFSQMNNKYSTIIKNIDSNHDNYIYKFKFDYGNDFQEDIFSTPQLKLRKSEKFLLYLNYLKKNNMDKEELIYSTIKLLSDNKKKENKKYEFGFLIIALFESFDSQYFIKFLGLFKLDLIKGLGIIPEENLLEISNFLNNFEKKVYTYFEHEDNESDLIFNFNAIHFYINFNFFQDKIKDMFSKRKARMNLYKVLLEYEEFFMGLSLKKEQIIELISTEYDFSFHKLIQQLKYTYDFLSILQIINEKRDLFLKKFIESKEDMLIEIEFLALPQKEDDIDAIYQEIKKIISFEKESNKYFVRISDRLIDNYTALFESDQIDKLIVLNEIINYLQKEEKGFSFHKNLDELIYDTGINLSNKKSLKNKSVLDIIENVNFYHDKLYNNPEYRSVEILSSIDVSKIDEDFIKKWKKLKLFEIFNKQNDSFINKVCSLVQKMSEFDTLLELLNKNENDKEEKDYDKNTILKTQSTLERLIPTYSPEGCPNFNDNIADLIYYSDKYKANFEHFNKDLIQSKLNEKIVCDIYIHLSKKFDELSNNIINTIVDFILKNPVNNKPENLVQIIKEGKELRKYLFNKMDKFLIKESDLYSKEESNNFKLLKGLINEKIFIEDQNIQMTEYILESSSIIRCLITDINDLNINYLTTSFIFDNELGEVLYERLKIISSPEDDPKNIKEKLQFYYEMAKSGMDNLQNNLNDLQFFYKNKKKQEIIEIDELILKIKNGKMALYNQYKPKVEDFAESMENELKDKKIFLRSRFFRNLYIHNKKKYLDEEECVTKSLKDFHELKNIFDKGGLRSSIKKNSKEKLLATCLRGFKQENIKEELTKEINQLEKLLEISDKIDKNKIIQELIIFSKREKVFNSSRAMLLFIDKSGAKKRDFSDKLKNINSNIFKKKELSVIKKSIEELKNNDINFDKFNPFIEILIMFKDQPNAIDFLFQVTTEEIKNMHELLFELDEEFVTTNDLLNLEKCVEFFDKLGKKDKLKYYRDIEIISKFKAQVEKDENNSLIIFQQYIDNFGEIKELYTRGLDKSETSKKIISCLYQKSKFIITNEKNQFFSCKYLDQKSVENNLTLENILELRDRAQLSKAVSDNKKETEISDFINIVSKINTIYEYMQEIYYKGYPKSITIEVVINHKENKGIEFMLDNNKVDDYNLLYNKLKEIKDELKSAQINAYKNKPLIRYIYGRQFNFMYDALKNNKNKKEIESLLKYFTNNLITKYLDKFDYKETNNIFEDLITNCDNYFKKIFEINNLTLEKIYEETIVDQKLNGIEYKGMYIYSCNNLEKQVYQIYKYLTKHTPSAQNILLCNEDTSYEEIASFLYRAIFCEFNSCFIVYGIEQLKYEQKSNIIELLNDVFVENYEKMKSCLIFLYTNRSSDISKTLSIIKYRKILGFNKVKEVENIMSDDKEIEVITSDKSGVGKSHKILRDIQNKNNKYKHFPLGGNIIKGEIIERLKKLNLDKFCEIHLDLYDTDQIQLMNEFLFSILFTKAYKNNDELYYFSYKNPIKIEIQNSFIELFYKFPILTLFERTNLSIKELSPYDIPNDITSREQIVANYLKALEKKAIDNEDINFPTITPKLDTSKISKYSKKYNYKLVDAELIPKQECYNLILGAISKIIKIMKPSYYQIKIFIEILGYQLIKFSQNYFLSALNILSLGDKNLNQMRSYIVKNLIQITKYFVQGAFDELISKQTIAHRMLFGQYDEEKDIRNAFDILATNKSEFSFDKIEYPLIIFHEGETNGFSILPNKNNKDNEYGNLVKLYDHYKKYKKKLKEKDKDKVKDKDIDKLRRYDLIYIDKFEQRDFLVELKDILDCKNPIEKSDKYKGDKKSMEEIVDTYVFTPDNFIKMIFILIRLNANIPVILMGETGCGKTSLIRKLSELLNEGDINKMISLNIHAGTTEKDITNFINKEVIKASVNLVQKECIKKYNNFNECKYYLEKKIWLFLDEINTCNSLGLISELMCNRSFLGEELYNNIIVVGACNPYRESSKTLKEKIGLDPNLAYKQKEKLTDKEKEIIKKNSLNSNNKLVYRVNPLPFSLMHFVMDFGSLSEDTERKYIESMVKDPIKKQCNINNVKDINMIKDLAINMIVKSQNFIRENYDKSSVSLREIRRFNIFFDFFCNYLSFKKNNANTLMENLDFEKEYSYYQSLNETNLIINAVILSIYICYYLRISNKDLKIKLCDILNGISTEITDFLEIPKLEQEYLLKNIKLEKGISKNNALLENIFSLLFTIINKVPIFIVGKPGCSKSLSVQLINKAMKGVSSNSQLFKYFPKLIINSYQGSMGSTSKGVDNVFSKTRNILKNVSKEDKRKIIPMIFFDEMGLAEYSPYNPLKIIHSQLEYDLNEGDNKIAFVGISNWELDAAKMNRGIFISIPEPDEEDVINTSLTIAKSFNENLAEKHNVFFKNLGKIYYNYKQYLKTKHNLDGKEDFHGNRDFYHFVKNCAHNSSILYEKGNDVLVKDLVKIGLKSIERNFAGVQFETDGSSVKVVKENIDKIYSLIKMENDYNIVELIKDNINDINSRYLLLESKSPANGYLISSLLTDSKKDYCFYLGSKFEKDLKSEEYILKVLNKLQIYLEQDKILILENLDSVYPALYDLFNQNFVIVANKEYTRLAVGSTSNSYSLVNPNFRCIVNVNINDMEKQEIPFLNRFEKQMITYEYILNKELIDESNRIKEILKSMTTKNPAYNGINYDLEKMLINCDIEEIRGEIYIANKKGIEKGKLIDEVLSKISLTLPQDILLYLKFNGFIQKHSEEYKKINQYYQKGEHINLSRFIKNMKNTKNVVYTFSNELDVIKNIHNINNDILGNINKIKTIKVNSIESEVELEKNIKV